MICRRGYAGDDIHERICRRELCMSSPAYLLLRLSSCISPLACPLLLSNNRIISFWRCGGTEPTLRFCAVPLGLLMSAFSGRRCAIGIADQRALRWRPCHQPNQPEPDRKPPFAGGSSSPSSSSSSGGIGFPPHRHDVDPGVDLGPIIKGHPEDAVILQLCGDRRVRGPKIAALAFRCRAGYRW